MQFELDEAQVARYRQWKDEHMDKAHPDGVKDCTGAMPRFTFIPTGLGDNVTVECIYCPDVKLDLSYDDDGEFLFNVDGTRNGW